MGDRRAKEGGDLGLSRGQPCCKLPFLYKQYSENYCFVKSNICWGVGVVGWEEGLFWASVEQMPRMPGGDQLPLQIRALNYKVFTNANSWGKSSALICVMVSVTGD